MTTKFKEKFRLDSTRLSGYDYTQSAMYHVTICTKKKKSFLGDLVRYDNTSRNDSKVILTSELSSNMSVISPKTGSLSVIIRSFKSAVTYHARKIHPGFGWQPRFHDHIIRNMDELERIRKYIRSNPDNH